MGEKSPCSGYYQWGSFGFSPEGPGARRGALGSARCRFCVHGPASFLCGVAHARGGGALLVLLVSGPVGVDVFSIVIRKGGNSQRLGLVFPPVMMLCVLCVLTDLDLKDLSSG